MDRYRWINKGQQVVHINIALAERRFGAEYVADLCLKDSNGNWTEEPFSIFWQEIPPKPEFCNYFGLRREGSLGSVVIVNGSSVAEGIWEGAQAENGEIIFSRFRHDHRQSQDFTAAVDGGRDYFRYRGTPVHLQIVGPDFRVVDAGELSGKTGRLIPPPTLQRHR